MDCVIIRLVDMPPSVHGVTIKDENDDYNVYINARLSADERAKAYKHEMDHILRGHFWSSGSVADKEAAVRRRMAQYKAK